jgi:hypothetical protein
VSTSFNLAHFARSTTLLKQVFGSYVSRNAVALPSIDFAYPCRSAEVNDGFSLNLRRKRRFSQFFAPTN